MNLSFFYETLRLGLVNLHLHKLRSFLTTLGIVIGVLAVITMLAIGEGGKRETLRTVEQLGATNIIMRTVPPADLDRRRGDPSFGIKVADLQALRAEMGRGAFRDVVMAVPVRDSGLDIMYRDRRADKCAAVATTPEFLDVANLTVDRGRFLTATDMHPDTKLPVCVLGAGAAKKLFGNEDALDDEEPHQIRIQSQRSSKEFTVVGVLKPVGSAGSKGSTMSVRDLNDDVYFPLMVDETGDVTGSGAFGYTLMKRSPTGTRDVKVFELTQIYFRVSDVAAVRPVAAALARYLEIRPAGGSDVTLDVPLELLRQAEEQQWLWNLVLGGVAALALLVGGIGIMNISLATVTERTREIGIRRALGGKKRHIIVQFLIETMTLSGVGGLVGVAAGIATPMGITWAVKAFADKSFPTHVTATSVILSFTISAGVGVLAGLYPAIVAANKDPIESLRHD